MEEKPVYVVKPSLPPLEEYVREICDMWETGILTHTGPKHVRLQSELEKFMEADHVSLFANGHLALELGIEALGLSGEVITTPFTFGSTVQAVLRNGLTPVFCDINAYDYTIDCDKIEALITDKTSAILPVHVYGNLCDADRIRSIADRYHLRVIYDAAHAFGEVYKGRSVAALGDMSMFSFHATKVFHTVEGGCLTFSDAYADKIPYLNGLKQFGQILHTDETPYTGTNAKMTEMHAAMGLCNLAHVKTYIKKRKLVADRYRMRLDGIAGIRLCPVQEGVVSNYAYVPVVFEHEKTGISRDEIQVYLEKHHIFARRYFYPLCSEFACCIRKGLKAHVPVASYISRRVLTLPCYPDLEIKDVDRICDLICEKLSKGSRV